MESALLDIILDPSKLNDILQDSKGDGNVHASGGGTKGNVTAKGTLNLGNKSTTASVLIEDGNIPTDVSFARVDANDLTGTVTFDVTVDAPGTEAEAWKFAKDKIVEILKGIFK